MPISVLPAALAALIFGTVAPAQGQGTAETCTLPGEGTNPLADRAGLLAQYERLPQACLHTLFFDCNDASRHSLLDLSSAAVCSLGYEALLRQRFKGDFRELMDWWRNQREMPPR